MDLTERLALLGQWHQGYTMALKWEGQEIYEGFGGKKLGNVQLEDKEVDKMNAEMNLRTLTEHASFVESTQDTFS
jgi:hypothetical protein